MRNLDLSDGFENANGIVKGFYVRSICKDGDGCLYLCFVDPSNDSVYGAIAMGRVKLMELRTDDLLDFDPTFTFIDLWVRNADGQYDVYAVFSSFELWVECDGKPTWVQATRVDMDSLVVLMGS